MDKKQLGKYGENIACYYLKKKGYKILARNYKKEWSGKLLGEIDIIAEKDKIISFVEVKSLCFYQSFPDTIVRGEDKIDFGKRNKISRIAQIWLNENKMPLDSKWQIEAISMTIDLDSKKARIRHFQNI